MRAPFNLSNQALGAYFRLSRALHNLQTNVRLVGSMMKTYSRMSPLRKTLLMSILWIFHPIGLVIEKFGLVFSKLTNVTIHLNSTFSRNTRQNSDTK